MTPSTTGIYNISSVGTLDTYGALYRSAFYSYSPSMNLLVQNNDGAGNGQFALVQYLLAGTPYILVVTTFIDRVTGPFSLMAAGPGSVSFFPNNTTMQMSSPWYMNSTMPMYSPWYMNSSMPMYSPWSMYNSTSGYQGYSKSSHSCACATISSLALS